MFIWEGGLARFYEDLGFSNQNIGKRAENFCHMNTSARLPEWILQMNSASFWFACGIFHIISIQFNCSDTYSYKSCQSYERCESYNYVFCHVCFCFLNFMPQLVFDLFLISEFGLKFLIFSKVKLVPVSGSARSTGLMWRGPYFMVKNLWDVDLKINWFVKISLHGHQRVAHSGLWAPDGSPSTQFATWNFGCGLVHSWTHRE